jgi:hypothetical protein
MSDGGNNPEWWIDGVSVGSTSEKAPEPAQDAVTQGADLQHAPTSGVTGGGAPGQATSVVAGLAPATGADGAATVGDAAAPPPGGATGALAASTVPPPGPTAKERRRRASVVVLSALILVGIVLIVYFVFLTGGAPSYKTSASPHPTSVLPSSVFVGFGVKNTGSATGKPTCTVRVALATGRALGKGRFTLQPLGPHKGALEVEQVTVTQTALHPFTREQMNVKVTCT